MHAAATGHPAALRSAVVAAGVAGSAYLALAVVSGGGLGLGDVKLATVLCCGLSFAGPAALVLGVVVPHLINGPVAVVLLLRRRRRRTVLPFGPALLLGAWIAVVATV